jgi:hypothetical protein
MNLKCKLGFHIWDGCKCIYCFKIRDEQHNWSSNCEECSKCGKTRDNQHEWTRDCEKCSKCGKTREEQHKWNGCRCTQCYKIRDEQHNWSSNCEECSKCYKKRNNQHEWSKDCEKCSKCGVTRDNKHHWGKNNEKCSRCYKHYQEFLAESLTKRGPDVEFLISKITDQALLAKVVSTPGYSYKIAKIAMDKIRDQTILKNIVFSKLNSSNNKFSEQEGYVAEYAITKITDQKILSEISISAIGNDSDEIKNMKLSLISINLLRASNNFDSIVAEKLKVILPKIHELCSNEDTSHGGFTYWQYYSEWIKVAETFLEAYYKK